MVNIVYVLELRKPLATIRHTNKVNGVRVTVGCEQALEINPDSAKAFRARGKAEAMMGRWIAAVKDLATAQ
eukprot:2193747-Rhodomonas_salina.1